MHEVNLRSLDLNLLVVLQVLLEERHVSRAAERLHMSQPAVSRALQRLRQTFNDPLLVRTADGYDLSARSQILIPQLVSVIQGVQTMISKPEFDPASADSLVRISGLDLEMAVYLPKLTRHLQRIAPKLRLEMVPQKDDHFKLLDKGDIHFSMTGLEPKYGFDQFHRMEVDRMPAVCLMDQDNPLAHQPLTIERYTQARHGLVSLTGRGPGFVDLLLEKEGLTRTVYLRLYSFISVADFCQGTDLIFTLPLRLAERITESSSLVIRTLPPELRHPSISFYLYWHSRFHRDPLCQWLRSQFQQVLQPIPDMSDIVSR